MAEAPRSESQHLAQALLNRFAGRLDAYLCEKRQCVREPLTLAVVEAHLRGEIRIGIYSGEYASFCCFDSDGKNLAGGFEAARQQMLRIFELVVADLGLDMLLERSRSGDGLHGWVVLEPGSEVGVTDVKRFGRLVFQVAGLPHDENEKVGHPGVYPHPAKPRERGGKGMGKTPYLPWCGLTVGAETAVFIDAEGRTLDNQEEALANVVPVSGERFRRALKELEARLAATHQGEPPTSSSNTTFDGSHHEPPPEAGPSRHNAIVRAALRLRNLLPEHETRVLILGLGELWGVTRDRGRREMEDAVASAYAKPPIRPETEWERWTREGEPDWTPSTLEEVLNPDVGQVEYVVENLIPAGEVTVLGAGWKTGKTLITYQLVLDLVSGRRALGHFAAKEPIKTVLFQLEMPAKEDARRFRRLGIGSGMMLEEIPHYVRSGLLTVYNRPNLDLTTPEGCARFHQVVRASGARVVVIDSLLAATQNDPELLNNNTKVRKLFSNAFAPLTTEGITIIALHHKRKGSGRHVDADRNALLGAQAFGACAGRVYSLERLAQEEPTQRDREFKVRLSLMGSWTPEENVDVVIQVKDVGDEGTLLQVMTEDRQLEEGGVTAVQRAALALARLVRFRRRIAREDAETAVKEEVGIKERAFADALKYARAKGWVAVEPVAGTKNKKELVPGPSEAEL